MKTFWLRWWLAGCGAWGGILTAQEAPPLAVRAFELSQLDQQPKLTEEVQPEFPFDMRVAGLQGEVLVDCVVDEKGRVRDAFAVRSNNPWYERPALEAAAQWEFEPGRKDGRAVKTHLQRLLIFRVLGGNDRKRAEGLWTVTKPPNHNSMPPEMQWDQPPKPVSTAFAVYPLAALRQKIQGKFRAGLLVDPRGRVIKVEVEGTAPPELAQAARAMLDLWVFEPAKKAGQPCHAMLVMELNFSGNDYGSAPLGERARAILRELERTPVRIVNLAELDAVPKPISRRPPTYPSSQRGGGETGRAMIEFFIDEDGDAQLPHVLESSRPEFGYAAAQAVAT